MAKRNLYLLIVASAALSFGIVGAAAQEKSFFTGGQKGLEDERSAHTLAAPAPLLGCSGPVAQVTDIGYEGTKSTTAVFGSSPGGGVGGQFDKTPLLTTRVKLSSGCLNANLSAIVGSHLYGASPLALFQVTLTPASGGPAVTMAGHFPTPYGIAAPAIGMQAENDVDMLGANFFERIGTGVHAVPPGNYIVNVWWAGAPPAAPNGAVGFAFVLKLYYR
jgi:hypothetical protein